MLIQAGKVSTLEKLPWVAIELTSEARTDEIVLHLTKWAVRNLEKEGKAFQLLYPVESRSLTSTTMLSPYLWMRVLKPQFVSRITSVTGVQGMVLDHEDQPVLVETGFVDSLIEKAKAAADSWSAGIVAGSGVRVLLGTERMLCGVVEKVVNRDATVRIAMRSRAVRLKIPVRALQKLSTAPKDYFLKEED